VTVSLGGTANLAGSVSVDSSLHLVHYRSADNHLWTYYYPGGSAWSQVRLSTTANVGDKLVADSGRQVYCGSSVDGSAWALYWSGTAWTQVQLNSSATISTAPTLYAPYYVTYINPAGQCALLYFAGSAWVTGLFGTGGANLMGGLGAQSADALVFARRSDGHIVRF